MNVISTRTGVPRPVGKFTYRDNQFCQMTLVSVDGKVNFSNVSPVSYVSTKVVPPKRVHK